MPVSFVRLRWTWPLAGLASAGFFPSFLRAEIPHATQYTYEHSNGLWTGLQDDKQGPVRRDSVILDQGKLSSVRASDSGSETGAYAYGLGVDEDGHAMNQVRGEFTWFRRSARHDLTLGLEGALESYRGTTSMLTLDQQFSLDETPGNGAERLNDFTRKEGRISAADTIRLSPTVNANVGGSHERAITDINSLGSDKRTLDSVAAGMEQRWLQSALSFNLLSDTLLTKVDDPNGALSFQTRQTTTERILRYTFPLMPRLGGRIGYRDIRLAVRGGPNLYRHGPELGLAYTGQNWTLGLELSSLRDKEDQSETFGRASVAWQLDEKNRFSASYEKSITLQSIFTVLPGDRDALIRPQQSVVETKLNWERTFGRQRFTLGYLHSDLNFEGADVDYAEESLIYAYSLSPVSEMTARLAFNQTRFAGEAPLTDSRRSSESLQLGVRQFLKGTLSATGGRMFVSGAIDLDRFEETTTAYASKRVAFLINLGQVGNF
jgi:hypothetical protein